MLFPVTSVKLPAATSKVTEPEADGVNMAVYTVLEIAVKLLKVPPVTLISPTAKPVVGLEVVKISGSELSPVAEPLGSVVAIFLIRKLRESAT